MFTSAKRFSGELSWLAPKLPKGNWNFIGCLNSEDRCVSALEKLFQTTTFQKVLFYNIKDQIDPSGEWPQTTVIKKTGDNRTKIKGLCTSIDAKFLEVDLMDTSEDIEKFYKEAINFISCENLFVDITAFPKRYFLPLVLWLLKEPGIKNLVAINSQPEKYFDGKLSKFFKGWEAIYPFNNPTKEEKRIFFVGVGFMPLGLPKAAQLGNDETKYFFPFPPGPPNFSKNWLFLSDIQQGERKIEAKDILFVDATDVSRVFDLILKFTQKGTISSHFAPFGPKPITLAMGLYASYCERNLGFKNPSIFYTQPTIYNPDYSSGFKKATAYCIKLEGKELYTIDP